MKKISIYTLWVLVLLMACTKQPVPPPSPVLPVPSEEQLNWHEMELNAFIHFTTNTFTDLEWGYGDESPAVFDPAALDANQWVKTIKSAGFKGLILTCKHHDGFCLWPSQYSPHSMAASPYKNGQGDLVEEVSEACKNHGIKFGVYLSPWDRNHPGYGQPDYVTYYRNQLKEVIDNYGPVFELWFDGANGGDGYYGGANEKRIIDRKTYYDWPTTILQVRKLDTAILFFSDAGPDIRWCGNEAGYVNETNWNTLSPDTLYAGKSGVYDLLGTGSSDGTAWIPAEVDVSIRPGWFYHQSQDSLVKTPEQLFNIYLQSVGRGALLLLNIPPDRNGLLRENDLRSLAGFKAIIDSVFTNNLALNATFYASNTRGNANEFSPDKLHDGNKDTYWATDDSVHRADLEIRLNSPQVVQYLVIQEYIKLGQRIKEFEIEALENDRWTTIAHGTTVGYKRIVQFNPVETNGLRLKMLDSKACPVLSNIEIY
ncbi:MAG: alpha-L-fucosidase [Bacteroidales bacterium]